MTSHHTREELERVREQLSPKLQQRVLEFAYSLAPQRRRGVCGHELLRFAGTVPPDEARAMNDAIEAACEHLQHDQS